MSTEQNNLPSVWKELDSTVSSVISQTALIGFEKAFLVATATVQLQQILTPEYMRPIMALQGISLGFKSDKVYDEQTVKKCLIEAVLWGVQPVGNQFNIIAGNAYITKEGYGYMLSKLPGITYSIVPALPRINSDQTGAAIDMSITWYKNGQPTTQVLPIAVRMNRMMGIDAIIGKATRKARKWLYDTITGNETPDGDIEDLPSSVVGSKQNTVEIDKEAERIEIMVDECGTPEQLAALKKQVEAKYHHLFAGKEAELNGSK